MAYHTHFLTSKALQQSSNSTAVVSPSRGSTSETKRVHQQRTIPFSTIKGEHLPPIQHPQAASVFCHYSKNDLTSKRAAHFLLNFNKSPVRPYKQYITKSMSTTTTTKKPVPAVSNSTPLRSTRRSSNESNKRVFKKSKLNSVNLFTKIKSLF